MRAIGQAEVALEKICRRLNTRVAFGKPPAEQSVMLERVAEARIEIDQTRLLVLKAADTMDKLGVSSRQRTRACAFQPRTQQCLTMDEQFGWRPAFVRQSADVRRCYRLRKSMSMM
jgi:alkylation response protein AidB-like acyl-CoA dehydrogenase